MKTLLIAMENSRQKVSSELIAFLILVFCLVTQVVKKAKFSFFQETSFARFRYQLFSSPLRPEKLPAAKQQKPSLPIKTVYYKPHKPLEN